MTPKKIGLLAEEIARDYLTKKGYKILAANYRTSFGEIDIIGKKNDLVTFFEVKANKNKYIFNFNPEIRVNYYKRNRLKRLANAYLADNNIFDISWQIDIISIIFDLKNKKAFIKHFKRIVED